MNMLLHRYNLPDNLDQNIRKLASQKHPLQARADRKTRKASKRIKDESQECLSTSSESNKGDINFTPNQLRF